MKSLVLIIMFSILNSARADEARFFVGTYTNDLTGSKGIYTGTIDLKSGKLSPLELAAAVENPGFLAIPTDGRFLYAALETPHQGFTAAFRLEPEGRLTGLNQQNSGGEGTCHVCVDASGHHVLAANYGGGNLSCFQTGTDGSLGERTALVQFTGSGPDPDRQSKPHAHSVYVDPLNRFVYSCDLGTDNIWIFKFNAATGVLERNSPAFAKVPAGGGPRHLAFHPTGRYVYANNEMGLTVSVFERDPASGALTPVQEIRTLTEGTTGLETTTAEIACHPSGKWLYVSNRGDNSVAIFGINSLGRLTRIANSPAGVKGPRSFAIDPTGRWLIAAGQNDNRMIVLKIDPATGGLNPTDQIARVGSPVCVLFAPAN